MRGHHLLLLVFFLVNVIFESGAQRVLHFMLQTPQLVVQVPKGFANVDDRGATNDVDVPHTLSCQ